MLLDLLENGSEAPMPISWPGRVPVAGFVPVGVCAQAGMTVMPISAGSQDLNSAWDDVLLVSVA
jgi:hypothetical protein